MRELYKKVDKILCQIDFNKIWSGFSKFTFALYDNENVYFKDEVIPYDQRFLGNTSIEYGGQFIAIWNIDNPDTEDSELLAADLVHEMFHAFQRTHNDNRFPNDLIMLNYPDSPENFNIKHSENLLLARAFLTENIDVKKECLEKFLSARKYRENIIGDIIKQEYYTEAMEGIAEYAGCMALKQISQEKYIKRINGYIENLQILDERFFDIRRMSYYTGVAFCVLLLETGMIFYHKIGETELSLLEIVSKNSTEAKPDINFDEKLLSVKTKEYIIQKKLKFDEFFQTHNEKITGDYFICGYDPMNMIKLDNMILCSHFIMLKSENNDEPVFIQGAVTVVLKNGSVNEIQSYIK